MKMKFELFRFAEYTMYMAGIVHFIGKVQSQNETQSHTNWATYSKFGYNQFHAMLCLWVNFFSN